MLLEAVKQSDGKLIGVTADDDGKLLISGVTIDGDVTIGSEVEVTNDDGNPIPVSGPLTDTQLRANAVPVSADALPLPTGAATSAQIGEVQASPTADTVLGRLKALATLLNGGLPASLGAKTATESLPVTLSTDGAFATNFGATADAAASTDTGTFSHLALLKRLVSKIPALGAATSANSLPVTLSTDGAFSTAFGAKADAAASDDTGSYSHIALIKRLLTKVPGFTRATTTAAITVANSTTISASVDLLGTSILAFVAPAAWTTSTLKLQGSNDNSNWFDIYDQYGVQVSSFSAITASVAYSIDVTAMLPYRYIRFVAGTAQAADRTFTVVTRPLA